MAGIVDSGVIPHNSGSEQSHRTDEFRLSPSLYVDESDVHYRLIAASLIEIRFYLHYNSVSRTKHTED